MKKIYRPGAAATALCLLLSLHGSAQKTAPTPPPARADQEMTPPAPVISDDQIAPEAPEPPLPEMLDDNGNGIIIRQKGKKDSKITVEMHGGDVLVNGKPISDFRDKNFSVSRIPRGSITINGVDRDFSPFRENAYNEALNQVQLDQLQKNLDRQQQEVEINVDRAMRQQDKLKRMQDMHFRSAMSNEAYLGVASKKSGTDGALVADVTPASPAEKAGLKKGDIITKVNGNPVHSPDELYNAIHGFKPGDKIKVSCQRDGKEQTVSAVLEKSRGGQPGQYRYQYDLQMPRFDHFGESLGEGMDDQPKLGLKARDAEDGKGVDVLDITPGSAAEKAGLKKGDNITQFDGAAVNSAGDLAEKAADARTRGKVSLGIVRDGKTQEIELHIPRKLRSAEL